MDLKDILQILLLLKPFTLSLNKFFRLINTLSLLDEILLILSSSFPLYILNDYCYPIIVLVLNSVLYHTFIFLYCILCFLYVYLIF